MTNHNQKGFTLTELTLSMAFVSFLLIFIMTAVVQVMRIYSKGLSIREINQSGRQFSEEFTKSARYGKQVQYDATNQRICVNGVTYAWNPGDPQNPPSPNKNEYATGGAADGSDISMVRTTGVYCGSNIGLPKANSRDVLPPDLNVQRVSYDDTREGGRIAALTVLFSTGGANAPIADIMTPTGFACKSGSDGAYCAFGEFEATVYIRN